MIKNKNAFDSAIKIPLDEYHCRWLYDPLENKYVDVDDLWEYESLPDFFYACKRNQWSEGRGIDIDTAITHALEYFHGGTEDVLIDLKELKDFVDTWNAKQTLAEYYPNFKLVIVIKK